MRRALILVGALLLASSLAQGQTVVTTEEVGGVVKKIIFDWTSAADGSATATTSNFYNGKIEAFVTDPDGTDAPTDDYDVTIADADGTDVLSAAGQNRDTANTEIVLSASLGIVANDKLSLTIAAAGNAKKGKIYLYVR
jgi:hypothetical protein